jgi:hypothetical protein
MLRPDFPRWSLAVTSSLVAALCAWAAMVLPWRSWTMFAVITSIVGAVHLVTALLAWFGLAARAAAWRVQAIVSLTYLGYLTWNTLVAATSIAALYGGLGRGVAVALGLAWCVAAFVTLPMSLWGIAATGGLPGRKRVAAGTTAAVLLVGGRVAIADASMTPVPTHASLSDRAAVAAAFAAAIPSAAERGPAAKSRVSLATTKPAKCKAPPGAVPFTAFVTWLRVSDDEATVVHDCVQADELGKVVARVAKRLGDAAAPGPIALDVVKATDALGPIAPVVDGMQLRPGIDGVCLEERCFAPWQMLALDAFTASKPIPVVPEFRFGFDPAAIRKRLGGEPSPDVDGLVRIETWSFVAADDGALVPLHRLREDGPALTTETVHAAKLAAERYILSAQGPDGRFEYRLDPFIGKVSYAGFSLARQAGTTLVVCELAEDRARARQVATAALGMLVSTQRRHTLDDGQEIAALYYPIEKPVKKIALGDTALSTIALLSCRDLVGPRYDADIDRMTRYLLHMQRPDGGFYPSFDLEAGAPVPGPDPLYAVGQAVFALSLLEALTSRGDSDVTLAPHDQVRSAVELAMTYTARDYWSGFAEPFFYMEENWHCLAARASLGHHRHDGYEEFCLDYVQYKARLIFDEDDGVAPDMVGGYGFSNVVVPHNTGSAGFGEAMSAALAIANARGLEWPHHEAALRRALTFLLHHQWNERNSFATSGPHPVAGGFSENMGSPHIRIDYVQHAMAALGHGGRVLGVLP